jgi:hypothetical protein
VVIAKYRLALKKKEESDNRFALVEEPGQAETAADVTLEDTATQKEENRRLWGEINYLKADRNLLREEVANLKVDQALHKEELASLHKIDEEQAQAIQQRVAVHDLQKVAKDVEVALDQLLVLKTSITDLKGKVDELKLASSHQVTLTQEVEKAKETLSKSLSKLIGVEESRKNILQILAELDALKKEVSEKLSKTPEGGWKDAHSELRGELDLLKSELKNLAKARSNDSGPDVTTLQAVTDISTLKEEMEILKSEVRKLLVNESSAPESDEESPAALRELRNDIKVVKILLTELVEKNPTVRSGSHG